MDACGASTRNRRCTKLTSDRLTKINRGRRFGIRSLQKLKSRNPPCPCCRHARANTIANERFKRTTAGRGKDGAQKGRRAELR